MTRLFANEYFTVDELPGRAVRVTRLDKAFTSRENVEEACEPVQAALDRLGRADYVCLIDSRAVRGSNDPEYERWFAPQRARMPRGFKRAALLMRTAIGALHSDRLRRSDGRSEGCRSSKTRPARAHIWASACLPIAETRGWQL